MYCLKWLLVCLRISHICFFMILLMCFSFSSPTPSAGNHSWRRSEELLRYCTVCDINLHKKKKTLIYTCSPLVCIDMVSTLSYVLLSTLIIELLLHHPPALWSIFKHLPSDFPKLFNIFYSNRELDKSGTNSLERISDDLSPSENMKRTSLCETMCIFL